MPSDMSPPAGNLPDTSVNGIDRSYSHISIPLLEREDRGRSYGRATTQHPAVATTGTIDTASTGG
jgi:hypothetical protein